jgi:hypothetical protein
MKRSQTLIALALTVSTLAYATTAIAAVKPGTVCKKVGSTSTSANMKYTCIKSGKKLIWNKGVLIPAPTPVVTPSASATPSPSPSPTQTPEPFQPTSLDDLMAHPESMSYWAWKKSALKISSKTDPGPTLINHIGPHTTLSTPNPSEAIVAVSRLYSDFALPTTVHAIYYGIDDIAWGQAEFAKYALRPNGQEAARQCQSAVTCWGALAEVDMKGNGILLIALGVLDSNHTTGTLEAHEYTHTIQATQFVGTAKAPNSYCCVKAYLPYWTVEGGAEFAQAAAIFPTSFDRYLIERKNDTDEFLSNRDGKFTLDWIKSYLDVTNFSMWNDSTNNWRMYDVGFLVNEALVAIKGPDISMQLNKDVANGMNWSQAFEKNMGVSWADALPKLAAAIKAQLKS